MKDGPTDAEKVTTATQNREERGNSGEKEREGIMNKRDYRIAFVKQQIPTPIAPVVNAVIICYERGRDGDRGKV